MELVVISPSTVALLGFISWAMLLLLIMEIMRSRLVLMKKIAANEFKPDNSNLSPFMQRLARAHANCIEGLPIFGGLLLVALVTKQASITDSLAYWFLVARIAQSLAHIISQSIMAVNARFLFFSVQLVIGIIWVIKLIPVLIQ